jgi:phospholipid transport system substrate-binding protein
MNPRRLLHLLAASILLPGALRASTDTEQRRLETAVNEVLAVADRASDNRVLVNDLRPVLLKYISFDAMTRRAVGPGWRQFTDDQRERATQLFATLVIRTYSAKLTPGEHPVITFKTATAPAPGRVEAPTTLLYKGSRYEVVYRMEEVEGWRITDVVIEGVSLIANYRTQFDAQFKKGGADAVLTALTQTLDTPR